MIYQLPNGKAIEISTEQYFNMSDDELEYLIAYNYGEHIENPWHSSILHKHDRIHDDNLDIVPDIIDVPEINKLSDLDAEIEDD